MILFLIGGISYYFIEILWRGYSYFVMFVLGGLCFLSVGLIREHFFLFKRNILEQMLISSLIITVLELAFGLILNLELGLDIWDYSSLRFNFLGQISLRYSIYWFFLGLPAIMFYDFLRYWLFGEEKPIYKLIE